MMTDTVPKIQERKPTYQELEGRIAVLIRERDAARTVAGAHESRNKFLAEELANLTGAVKSLKGDRNSKAERMVKEALEKQRIKHREEMACVRAIVAGVRAKLASI